MCKRLFAAIAFLALAGLSIQTAPAQLPSGLPRIPRPARPKPTPTPAETAQPATPATAAQPAAAAAPAHSAAPAAPAGQDQPTIAKNSVQVTAFTVNSYKGNYDEWSWLPKIRFRVNGPIPSGGQLYTEFSLPTGAAWVKFDCPTEETAAGRWWQVKECGGRDIGEAKSSLHTGPVNFAIKLRNELAGTDATLFTGKAKVEKVLSNEHGPKAVKKFVYFVNHDWNLPIGYVYLTPNDLKGWDRPDFHMAFWVRGDAYNFKPHLFHNGKEVGKKSMDGQEVGRASCESIIDNNTTHIVAENVPQKAKWSLVECDFPNIVGWDKSGEKYELFGPPHSIGATPGEYELKILWNNKLARSIKFTVGADGKFDNGIAAANKLGSDVVVVPVTVLGDQDGAWDRAAWKTDAFYGHPLSGFTPPPPQ